MKQLEKAINYSFKDNKLLETALTHSSYTKEHNLPRTCCSERLEFLGDAAIETVVCEELYYRCNQEREGILSRIKSDIVKAESLASVARNLKLGSLLKMGNGEMKIKGYERTSTLEDAFEALIGAVLCDSNYEITKKTVLHLLDDNIKKAIEGKLNNNYKSALQEYVQSKGDQKIEYKMVKEEGESHNKTFTMEVRINNQAFGTGIGKSKKEAEKNAAEEAVRRLKGNRR
jgi:ribonuclease-3